METKGCLEKWANYSKLYQKCHKLHSLCLKVIKNNVLYTLFLGV